MIKQEAIEILKDHLRIAKGLRVTNGVTKSLEVAIKALKVDIVYCENCKYEENCRQEAKWRFIND